MDRIEQITKLFQYGWQIYSTLEETLEKLTDDQLNILQKLYAAYHGLSSIGDILSHLKEIRFCKHPDTMQAQSSRCKWPDGNITWCITSPLPNFPGGMQAQVEATGEALAEWAKVCGIKPQYTPGNPQARIQIGYRAIDGQYGVLAESELPCGRPSICHQWYDTGDSWAVFTGSRRGNALDYRRVAMHELGHALGMNHIGAGNLLAPTYSDSVWVPQAGDIAEMKARYGEPVPQDPVPGGGGEPPPNGEDYILRFKGGKLTVDGYRLTKLLEAA